MLLWRFVAVFIVTWTFFAVFIVTRAFIFTVFIVTRAESYRFLDFYGCWVGNGTVMDGLWPFIRRKLNVDTRISHVVDGSRWNP